MSKACSGRIGRGEKEEVFLSIWKAIYTCLAVQCKEEGRPVESLWLKFRGETSRREVMVGICYRPPNLEEEMYEVFKQLTEAFKSQDLVLMGHLNTGPFAGRETQQRTSRPVYSWSVLGIMLIQVVERGQTLLDLLLTNNKELVANVKVEVELSFWAGRQIRVTTPNSTLWGGPMDSVV